MKGSSYLPTSYIIFFFFKIDKYLMFLHLYLFHNFYKNKIVLNFIEGIARNWINQNTDFLLSEPNVSSIYFDFLSGSLFVKNCFFYNTKHHIIFIDLSLAHSWFTIMVFWKRLLIEQLKFVIVSFYICAHNYESGLKSKNFKNSFFIFYVPSI